MIARWQVVLLFTMVTGSVLAQSLSMGGDVIGTGGGDTEIPSVALGAHVRADLPYCLSVETGFMRFYDQGEHGNGTLTVSTIGLAVMLSVPLLSCVDLYAGAGVDYVFSDMDIEPAEVIAYANNRSVEEHAAAYGNTVEDFRDMVEAYAVEGDLAIDNHVAWHWRAGVAYSLGDDIEWLVEYRVLFVELEGEFWTRSPSFRESAPYERDYVVSICRLGFSVRL